VNGRNGGRINWALLVAVLGLLLALAQYIEQIFDPRGTERRICRLEAGAKLGPCGPNGQ
jgi:hypothetical protein